MENSDYPPLEPVTGGRIDGVINGTISSGQAVVTVSNTTSARPSVDILGETDDGVPFYAQGTGVGIPGAQLATVVRQGSCACCLCLTADVVHLSRSRLAGRTPISKRSIFLQPSPTTTKIRLRSRPLKGGSSPETSHSGICFVHNIRSLSALIRATT